MTSPLGTADFFALEAGDYLDRLETLVTRPDGPDPVELVRTARGLRGSALMANQPQIARAAAGLEALARAFREDRRPWDAATREQSAQAVEEFRLLVRRSREWTDAETQRATRLAGALEDLAGGALGERGWTPRARPGELNPGVRAFVAREGALIASALDRAARAFDADPANREPLHVVLRRMQSLRGLAELSDLSPLPEILDGLELAMGDLTRLFAPPPGVARVLDAGAQALTRVSRDVADDGRPTPDTEEARRFTDLLLRAFAAERDVVPVESLLVAGDPDAMRSPTQPPFTAPAPLGPLELVSHGEHLAQTAAGLEDARSQTERDLRLYGLVAALRTLATAAPASVAAGAGAFADAARTAIASGAAAADPAGFAAVLREAGTLLHGAAEPGRLGTLGDALAALATRLRGAAAAAPAAESALETLVERPVAPPLATAVEEPIAAPLAVPVEPADGVVAIEALALEGEPLIVRRGDPAAAELATSPVVPIEALAPDGAEPPIVPIEALAPDTLAPEAVAPEVVAAVPVTPPDAVPEPAAQPALTPFEASFATYALLVRERGLGEPSLRALVAPATGVPVRESYLEPATVPGVVEPEPEPEPEPAAAPEPVAPTLEPAIVDIGALCYRGRAALERAREVRDALAARLAGDGVAPADAAVRPLLDELLDLVPLALDDA
ncbi:MAG TPA: hypothetical protein VFS40_09885 [Gemmatimonadales bacterium]|nr:hypothetical protein [Gemmatimonadales bacterium]